MEKALNSFGCHMDQTESNFFHTVRIETERVFLYNAKLMTIVTEGVCCACLAYSWSPIVCRNVMSHSLCRLDSMKIRSALA